MLHKILLSLLLSSSFQRLIISFDGRSVNLNFYQNYLLRFSNSMFIFYAVSTFEMVSSLGVSYTFSAIVRVQMSNDVF